MNCPFCASDDTKVTDSRPDQDGIRRRRECLACGRRFSTLERIELPGVALLKKDGRREAFDRSKITAGVRKACEKRPIPSGAVEALADEVEQAVYGMNRAEVPSSVIGELVMERLKALDHIAYIRFASVYRAFADVDELEQELTALKAGWRRPDVPPDQLALLPELGADAGEATPPQDPTQERRTRRRSAEKEGEQQMMDLSPEESQEHARLLNDYVAAVEAHKRLSLESGYGNNPSERVKRLWEADGMLELTREALERFRYAHAVEV